MKKEILRNILISIFRLILATLTVYLIYPRDNITSILIFFILITQPLLNILALRDYKNSDLKFLTFSKKFIIVSFALYGIFLITYGISLFLLNKSPLALVISIIFLLYGYNFYEKSRVKYNKDILIFDKNLIELKKIATTNTKGNNIYISYFNGNKKELKLSSQDEVKLIEKIIKRKM